jgi:hypothetical protein
LVTLLTAAAAGAALPTVTDVKPSQGPLGGENTVTITGANLSEASVVDFGATEATSFTVESANTIVATAPAGTGTVHVTVTTPGGTSLTHVYDEYTYVPPPTEVITVPTEALTLSSARIEAKESTTAALTDCHFEWGTSLPYGNSVPCSTLPGVGTHFVKVALTELTADTTFHFRVSVSNVGGTTVSEDATFRTLGPPEYGRCLRFGNIRTFGTSLCATLGGQPSRILYEWYPAFESIAPLGKTNFTTAIKPLAIAKIETVGKKVIACKGETSNGEYTGRKTIGNITITLTGCTLGADSCASSGAAEGEVVTSVLRGELGVISKSIEGPTKNKIGTDLKPASGEMIAQFACAGVPVTVSGAVIVEVKRNTMATKVTLKFGELKGVQKPTSFEGGPEEGLQVAIGEAAPVQAGLSLTTIQTNEEKVEANSAF